jgi:hypothetical protein
MNYSSEADSRRKKSDLPANGSSIPWRWGIVAASALTLLTLYPQLQLWVTSGENWRDAVAYNQGLGDEVAYAAYLNALIDGRPRRNDPYSGRDDHNQASLPESLFSIQFVPAYAVAWPARALGISAATAFMILTPLVAFASALAVFFLIYCVTGNHRLAATGVFVVLCLGALAAAEGTISSLTGGERHFDYFPFLRRYQPAASFPLFLFFLILVWRSLTKRIRPMVRGALAGLCLAVLVFSYFYLWTAALAWLVIVSGLWLVGRPADRKFVVQFFAAAGIVLLVALVPYFILISHGADNTRSVQALVPSRRADLFSAAEIFGALVLLSIAIGIRRRMIDYQDRRVLVAISLALLPFVVLNQQLITGRVMQPIHYKGFVTSYAVLLAMVLTAGLEWRRKARGHWKLSKRALVWIAIAALDWGGIEVLQAAKRSEGANIRGAQEMVVYHQLARDKRNDFRGGDDDVVLFDDLRMADAAPAAAPVAVLWAPHILVYPGVGTLESKERLYRHLYYTGVGVKELDAYFHGQNVYYGCAVGLFGFDRLIDGLNPNAKPITNEDKDSELRSYRRYIESFDRARAANPTLSYVVTPAASNTDLRNLDRWYQRDEGEQVGNFKIYKVRLRDELEEANSQRVSASNATAIKLSSK